MQRSLLLHGEIPASSTRPRLAVAAKGFRPFFLLAAAFACAIVPIWILMVSGALPAPTYVDATSWHAHEMIFGYATAVIAGFLLTAVGNWTGRETAVGWPLLGLAGLWAAGRVAMIVPTAMPRGLPAILDLAFLPALMVVLGRPLFATKNRRNFVMLAVLGALFVSNLFVHLDALGVARLGSSRPALLGAVDVVLLVIVIMAGRVFPMFTRNATGVQSIRSMPRLDLLGIVAMAAVAVLDVAVPDSKIAAGAAGVAGLLAAARAVTWGTRHTARHPLLWILHAGYGFLVVGLLLRAAAPFGSPIAGSLATHALTVGAIGGLTLGMMARVSLGHTGRMLAPPKPAIIAFGALLLAAVARAFLPLAVPGEYFHALVAAATLWTIAFLLFLVSYAPILVKPRVDGKPG